MGTPMAVNYANLFMASLETAMLDAYEKDHGIRPKLWLRYIDEIFFVFGTFTGGYTLTHYIKKYEK